MKVTACPRNPPVRLSFAAHACPVSGIDQSADPSVKAIVKMVFGYQRAGRIHAHTSGAQTSAFADAAGAFHLSLTSSLRPPPGPGETALNLKHDINSGEKWLTLWTREQRLLGSHMEHGGDGRMCCQTGR